MYCQFIFIAIVDNEKAPDFFICKNGYVKRGSAEDATSG